MHSRLSHFLNPCLVRGGQVVDLWWLEMEMGNKRSGQEMCSAAGQGLAWRFYGKHQTQKGAKRATESLKV